LVSKLGLIELIFKLIGNKTPSMWDFKSTNYWDDFTQDNEMLKNSSGIGCTILKQGDQVFNRKTLLRKT
jgi:hypothetical protein